MTDIQKQLAEALDLANDLWSKGCTSERLVKACDLLRQQHRRIEALEVELIGLRNVHRQQEAREPLTESEIDYLLPEIRPGDTVIRYGRAVARAVEAAHGIKGE